MRLLAVDTAAEGCSAAISVNGNVVAELTRVDPASHSRQVLQTIATLLTLAGFSAADLDALAVTIGPGAFTGVRIGLATVKGLAAALGRPVAGVSALDVLAMQAGRYGGPICAALDARRGEVYVSFFKWHDDELRCERAPWAASPERAFAFRTESSPAETTLFIGSGARRYRDLIVESLGRAAIFAPRYADTLRASVVAALGERGFEQGLGTPAAAVQPLYLRGVDAARPAASV